MTWADFQLVTASASVGESVDRIVCFKPIRQQFIERLPDDLRCQDSDQLVWRLFQLRKSGQLVLRHREN